MAKSLPLGSLLLATLVGVAVSCTHQDPPTPIVSAPPAPQAPPSSPNPATSDVAYRPPTAANNFGAPDGYRFGDDRDRQRSEYIAEEQRRRQAPPPGATARCKDGTYSYSATRRGACSNHGGVATWYR